MIDARSEGCHHCVIYLNTWGGSLVLPLACVTFELEALAAGAGAAFSRSAPPPLLPQLARQAQTPSSFLAAVGRLDRGERPTSRPPASAGPSVRPSVSKKRNELTK